MAAAEHHQLKEKYYVYIIDGSAHHLIDVLRIDKRHVSGKILKDLACEISEQYGVSVENCQIYYAKKEYTYTVNGDVIVWENRLPVLLDTRG